MITKNQKYMNILNKAISKGFNSLDEEEMFIDVIYYAAKYLINIAKTDGTIIKEGIVAVNGNFFDYNDGLGFTYVGDANTIYDKNCSKGTKLKLECILDSNGDAIQLYAIIK